MKQRPAWATRAPLAIAAVSIVIAAAYVVVTPPGQPYDEPAHWSNVQFYAHEHRMPEIGEPGASYEAQMGPVYYAGSAILARPVEAVFDTETAFYAVRLLGTLLVGLAVLLTVALGLELFPRRRGAVLAAAAFVGFNPNLLAVGASIQNDSLVMVMALWGALLAVRATLSPGSSPGRWLRVGLVAGLATITKIFAAGMLGGLAVAALAAPGRDRLRRLRGVVFAVAGFVVVSGWWFVRNQILYGDPSGRTGVTSSGLSFPPSYHSLRQVDDWLRSLLSYVWIPTEYYRNAFQAPGIVRVAVVAITIGIVGASAVGVRRAWTRRAPGPLSPRWNAALFLASWFALTFLAYTVFVWAWTSLAPRIVYVALPGMVILVSASIDVAIVSTRVKVAAATTTVAALLAISVFVLFEVNQIGHQPFWIPFG